MTQASSIAALFEAAVDRSPAATAVISGDLCWSYAELDAHAERIASQLRSRRVGDEHLVAVLGENRPEVVAAFIGVLKAGAAYVPLDPADPDERLGRLLTDAQPRLLLHCADARPRATRIASETLELDLVPAPHATRRASAAMGSTLAYVIYTSGSTGEPKGVAVEQRSVTRLVQGARFLKIGPRDRVGQAASCAFDAATFEIWGALLNGAALVILPREVVLDPAALGRALRRERITTLFVSTSLLHRVALVQPDAFASLDTLLFGGERAVATRVRSLLAAGAPRRLLNMYGPTETTVFATFAKVCEVDANDDSVPIGGPVADEILYVVDQDGHLIADGTAGELWIGGSGVARGYLNRASLTAARFIADPFSGVDGARLFRTGDRVRRRDDGALEFLGRFDDQVKIRGHRVEPGEIEVVLRRHSAVVDVAVVTHELGVGERRLVAHIVATSTGDAMARALSGYLHVLLPDYMVPAIALLDKLPLRTSGKINRAYLATIQPPLPEQDNDARTPTEERVQRLFCQLLDLPSVGRRSGFFELGGHSLLVGRLLFGVREIFGVGLTAGDFFRGPTIESLAMKIDGAASVDQAFGRPAPREAYPATPAQLEHTDPHDLVSESQRVTGPLDVSVLRRALTLLFARHSLLRASFTNESAGLVQRIAVTVELPFVELDLSSLPAIERERRCIALLTELEVPFDLARGPLARLRVFRLAPHVHVFAYAIHHIICDGVSLAYFWEDLHAAYGALAAGQVLPLLPPTADYADYADEVHAFCASPAAIAQRDRWRARLHGADTVRLPGDRDRAPVDDARRVDRALPFPGGYADWVLPPELNAPLRGLGRSCDAPFGVVLLAGFYAWLHELSGQTDIVVLTHDANRDCAAREHLIGLFSGMLPIRIHVDSGMSFVEVIERVRTATLEARAEGDTPRQQMAAPPILVAFNHPPPIERRLGPLRVERYWPSPDQGVQQTTDTAIAPIQLRHLDLDMQLDDRDHRLTGLAVFNAALFNRATMEARLRGWTKLLRAGVQYPARPLAAMLKPANAPPHD